MASGLTHIPELDLSPEESAKMADAIVRMNAEFDVSVLSPKAAAILNFGIVATGIVIPRFVGFKARKTIEKQIARAERERAN